MSIELQATHSGSRHAPPPLHVWLMAVRPRTLGAAAIPVLVGTAVAARTGNPRVGVALLCLVTAVLLQIAANLINDVSDSRRGIDTPERRGPTRVTQAGLLSASAVARAAWACLTLAVTLGAYLVWLGGAAILVIGLGAALAAAAYSAGPFTLASHALGELAAFTFFGLVAVLGTLWLQTGGLPLLGWLTALSIGALIANLMLINNLRDLETDRACGKRTLPVRLGDGAGRFLYALNVIVAFSVPVVIWKTGQTGPVILGTWLALPLAGTGVFQLVRARNRAAIGALLPRTALVHALFGALLSAGLLA